MADERETMTPEELLDLEAQLTAKQRELADRERTLREREFSLADLEHSLPRKLAVKEQEIDERLKELGRREERARRLFERTQSAIDGDEQDHSVLSEGLREQVASLHRDLDALKNMFSGASVPTVPTVPIETTGGRITLKDALAYVPSFNGENMSVSQFIRACKRACRMLPSSTTSTFLELIRQKFTDRARTAIEHLEYRSIQELENKLRDMFDTYRTATQCKAELENIVKGHNEPIVDYVSRAQTLHGDILHAETTERGELSGAEKLKIENDAVEAFLKGIPPLLRIECRLRDCKT